jgi:hypothetical protein
MAAMQRRSRRIGMIETELDEFLVSQRVCRVATVQASGAPHISPLWFVWDGSSIWLNSIVKSQRWVDLRSNPLVSVVVDTGDEYEELRGAELTGSVEQIGEVPRSGLPNAVLEEPERLWSEKYRSGRAFQPDGRHAWLRLVPQKTVSWDFRKLRTTS